MLNTRLRVRPCRPRWNPSSAERSMRRTSPSRTIAISACIGWVSEPRGPVTVTTLPSATSTSTPLGISMGCLPILLMAPSSYAPSRAPRFPSPDVGDDLAADPLARGLLVGHDALRRRHDRDAQAAEHT